MLGGWTLSGGNLGYKYHASWNSLTWRTWNLEGTNVLLDWNLNHSVPQFNMLLLSYSVRSMVTFNNMKLSDPDLDLLENISSLEISCAPCWRAWYWYSGFRPDCYQCDVANSKPRFYEFSFTEHNIDCMKSSDAII